MVLSTLFGYLNLADVTMKEQSNQIFMNFSINHKRISSCKIKSNNKDGNIHRSQLKTLKSFIIQNLLPIPAIFFPLTSINGILSKF